MEDSRVRKTGKNLIFSMIYYVFKILASFLVRTFFIKVFGVKFLGLNGIFTNVLSILSLAELGIGSAIVFNMYKPMAEGDEEKLKSLLKLYKSFYAWVAVILLVLGLLVIPILPLIIDYSSLSGINITILYIITLATTLVSYFMAHRRALLYTSQNKYIESMVGMIINVLLIVMQLIVLLKIKNYYVYICLSLFTSLVESIVIYFITNKMFPYVKEKALPIDKGLKKDIVSNTKAIFLHRIGGVTLNATDTLVMQIALNSLVISGIFSNYLLIYTTIISLISIIIDSMQGSVGNLIASKNKDYVYNTFKKMNFGFSWLYGFCSICLLCLYNPFISTMWGIENTWSIWFVLVYALTFYTNMSRQMAYSFKSAAGIFKQDRFAPLIEAVLNLVISYVLVLLFGPIGVVLGTLISCLLVSFWYTPLMLFKHYFNKPMGEYWKNFIKYSVVTLICGAITYIATVFIKDGTKLTLMLKFLICAVLPNLIYLLFYFRDPEFKESVKWGKQIIGGMLHRNKKVVINANIVDEIAESVVCEADEMGASGLSGEVVAVADELASINSACDDGGSGKENALEAGKNLFENDAEKDVDNFENDNILPGDEVHTEQTTKLDSDNKLNAEKNANEGNGE